MGISQAQADALLERGAISPETHAFIVGGASPLASSAPPPGMPPIGGEPAPPAYAPPPPEGPAMAPQGNGVPPMLARPPDAPDPSAAAPFEASLGAAGLLPAAAPPSNAPVELTSSEQMRNLQNPPPNAPGVGAMTIPEVKLQGPPPAARGGGAGGGGGAPTDPRFAAVAHEQGALNRAMGREGELQDLAGQRRVELADAEVARREALEQADVLAKARDMERQQAIDDAVRKRQVALDDYRSSSVDPDKYQKDVGVGGRISDMIAVALGGFIEGFSGGAIKNRALELVNQKIERTIRSQEIELEKKKQGVGLADNSLAVQRQLAGDAKAGALAERVRLLDQYQAMIAGTVAKYDNEAMRVNGAKTIDALEAQKVKLKDDLAIAMRGEEARRAAAAASAAAARDEKLFQRGVDVKKLDLESKRADIEGRKADAEIAKAGGASGSKAEQLASLKQDVETFDLAWRNAVRDLPGSRPAEWAGEKGDTDPNSRYQGAVAQLVGVVKGPGDNSETDAIRLRAQLPKPGDDEQTLAQKRGMMLAKLAQKHPVAAQAAKERTRGLTTAAPGQ